MARHKFFDNERERINNRSRRIAEEKKNQVAGKVRTGDMYFSGGDWVSAPNVPYRAAEGVTWGEVRFAAPPNPVYYRDPQAELKETVIALLQDEQARSILLDALYTEINRRAAQEQE